MGTEPGQVPAIASSILANRGSKLIGPNSKQRMAEGVSQAGFEQFFTLQLGSYGAQVRF